MNNYLQHHGILGMKWGVRRYQNADGTLTSEGRKRKKQEKHNDKISYYVGEKRLSRRIDMMEDQMTADLASVKRQRQFSVGQRSLVRKETMDALNNPSMTTAIGKATIKGRTLSTIGAFTTSGAAYVAAYAAGSAIPLAAIPASTIAAGVYWYKSMS